MQTREQLEKFLTDLITPANDDEKSRFSECVDDYIEIKNKIPNMTDEELRKEINHQLSPFNLQLDE